MSVPAIALVHPIANLRISTSIASATTVEPRPGRGAGQQGNAIQAAANAKGWRRRAGMERLTKSAGPEPPPRPSTGLRS